MGVPHVMKTHMINRLEIDYLKFKNDINLPGVYTKNKVPVFRENIPTAEAISTWSHLDGIVFPKIDSEIGLLIGNNIPDGYTPLN